MEACDKDGSSGISGAAPPEEALVWMAAHARPRCEKKLDLYCERLNIERYLPLRRETRIYQRRRVTVYKPLFPGYVFVRMPLRRRAEALAGGYIVRLLQAPEPARLEAQLAQIRRLLAVNPSASSCEAVAAGARVRVATGPLQGVEGIVESVKGARRLVVNVEIINRGVAIELDADAVRRIA